MSDQSTLVTAEHFRYIAAHTHGEQHLPGIEHYAVQSAQAPGAGEPLAHS